MADTPLSNHGFMLMLKGDFKGVMAKLDRAYMALPGLLTTLVVSDVHRLTGSPDFQQKCHADGRESKPPGQPFHGRRMAL